MDEPTLDPNEVIREIPGLPDYSVTDSGRVWSHKRGQWMATRALHAGHLAVELTVNGVRRRRVCRVHRLVLMAFRGQPEPGQECRHLNGDPADNRLENLAWGTPLENAGDRISHGRNYCGERHHKARLTTNDVKEIRHLHKSGVSRKSLAIQFGVSKVNIGYIVLGRIWKECA